MESQLPALTVRRPGGRITGRTVDLGYFDNDSSSITAFRGLRRARARFREKVIVALSSQRNRLAVSRVSTRVFPETIVDCLEVRKFNWKPDILGPGVVARRWANSVPLLRSTKVRSAQPFALVMAPLTGGCCFLAAGTTVGLAAILARRCARVFSGLMASDESGTLARLRACAPR